MVGLSHRRYDRRYGSYVASRWNVQECKLLKDNVKSFLKKEEMSLSEVLCQPKRFRARFHRCVAHGIKRTTFSVYRKIRREYSPNNYVGRWSKEMEQQLLSEYYRHGNNWAIIGCHLDVSARAARDKFLSVSYRKRIGLWLPDEETRLRVAMQKIHGKLVKIKDIAYRGKWKRVAKYVGTRNSQQCKNKWLLQRVRGERWTLEDDLKMIDKLLLDDEVEDEDGVDWVDMCSNWNAANSHSFLRTRWACLKRRVPGYNFKSFQENLDYLVQHVRPILKKKAEDNVIQEQDSSDEEQTEVIKV